MKVGVPPIKSQGIKTKLVLWIKSIIPSDFEGAWIEPRSYPDALNHFESFNAFRQYLAHDHGDFCLRSALIIAQLYQPGIAPVIGALELPQNGAASDSLSLISVWQLGQMMVGSVIALLPWSSSTIYPTNHPLHSHPAPILALHFSQAPSSSSNDASISYP